MCTIEQNGKKDTDTHTHTNAMRINLSTFLSTQSEWVAHLHVLPKLIHTRTVPHRTRIQFISSFIFHAIIINDTTELNNFWSMKLYFNHFFRHSFAPLTFPLAPSQFALYLLPKGAHNSFHSRGNSFVQFLFDAGFCTMLLLCIFFFFFGSPFEKVVALILWSGSH